MTKIIEDENLVSEWNYERNKQIDVNKITRGSHIKVWWKCSKGHEWEASVSNRARGTKCPYCSGKKTIYGVNDLFSSHPELKKEWNYDKNSINPQEISPAAHKKVWWKCSRGHEWETTIYSRTSGNGCPYCSGRYVIKGQNDFKTMHPELMKEWDFNKNKSLKPDEVLAAVNKNVWWRCSKGHEWQATINNRHRGTGCPVCSSETQTSFPEQLISFYLNKELEVENRYTLKGKEIDIFIPDLSVGIEYDGIYYHNSKNALEKEKIKDKILKENEVFLIRVKEGNKNYYDKKCNIIYYKPKYNYENLKDVIETILDILNSKFNLTLKLDFDLKRDNNQILSFYKTLKKKNSLAFCNKDLLKEWNYEKNMNLDPEFFDVNSGYKVWWKCSKGHEWQAIISSRNKGNSCPYCAGSLPIIGENDFETLFPDIAKEWNYNKNSKLKPNTFLPKSEKKVWWKCSKGHEWQASIGKRTTGNGCPYCASKKVLKGFNDFKTWCITNNYQYLIHEFDTTKNDFNIDEITAGSGKKVWWICPNKHSYQTYLTHRTQMFTGCPYCSHKRLLPGYNDLASTHPEIAKEWDYERNYPIKPNEVMAGSNIRKYWFICPNGHSYETTLLNRKKGTNCPHCYKNKR